MKYFLLILGLNLLMFNIGFGQGWHPISTGTTDDIHGLHMCDTSKGFMVTNRGAVIHFNGIGNKWSVDTIGAGNLLEKIFFLPDCLHGFAIGLIGRVYTTANGGSNWQLIPYDTSFWFTDIKFIDAKTGFMTGYNIYDYDSRGVIYKTVDAGLSWDSLAVKCRQPASIDISPENIISVSARGNIFISRDSGKTWETPAIKAGVIIKAAAIRGNRGIAVGMGGYLALSRDAGKSWQTNDLFDEKTQFFALLMLNAKEAYAIGYEGAVYYTDDSGLNWGSQAGYTINQLQDIQRIGNRIYACGFRGSLIYKDIK